MKRIILPLACAAIVSLLVMSCGSAKEKEDVEKNLQKDVQKELQKDTPKEVQDDTPSADGPKETMTVADAKKFIAADDANKGKLVTVSGYSRGTTKAVNGEFKLYVSDKTGTGLPEENFACNFKEDMKEAVRKHKAGELIKVTGNIDYNNGMIVLKNARLNE